MPKTIFDSNRFLMMINILNVSAKHLKDEMPELKSQEIEQRWQELLSTLYEYFAYAQAQNVDLREYKEDLREIMDNLYSVDKVIRHRNDGKISVIDDIAQVVMFVATKIDNVLESIGWKKVVYPITEAIYAIPTKIMALFSGETEYPKLLPDTIKKYLPPPADVLAQESGNVVGAKCTDVDSTSKTLSENDGWKYVGQQQVDDWEREIQETEIRIRERRNKR